jgi:hypothetical protein
MYVCLTLASLCNAPSDNVAATGAQIGWQRLQVVGYDLTANRTAYIVIQLDIYAMWSATVHEVSSVGFPGVFP